MKDFEVLFLLSIALLTSSCSTDKKAGLIRERLEKCNSSNLDSTILCGTYPVFENRETNSGRKIDLNIVVISAIRKNHSTAPIFFLEGGPGVSATGSTSFFADSINMYRIDHDIVLVDVRGTGHSNPLHCRQLQFTANLEEQFKEMYPVDDVRDCYDSLSKLADLTQYTSTNMASDIDEVRQWLGYEKIKLFGLSYGTRLAQVYMKMFPNSVESCVLWSPTTTYSRMPLYHAQFAEESINKLFNDCKQDPLCNQHFPKLNEEFRDLMMRGREKPFEYNQTRANGEVRNVKIPWHAFQSKIRSLMYSPDGLRQVPFIVHQSYLGNWRVFTSLFPDRPSYSDFLADGLYLCITCAEDVPFITNEESDSLAQNTFMGDYRVKQQQRACSLWARGSVPENFFEPVVSDIPTLIFSGYFDPVTPPSMAETIVKTLPNSFLVSIQTMSHTFDGLSNAECFDTIVIDFLNNPKARPKSDCTSQMLPGRYRTE